MEPMVELETGDTFVGELADVEKREIKAKSSAGAAAK